MYAQYGFILSVFVACTAYFVRPARIYFSALSLVLMGLCVGFLSVDLPYGFGIAFAILGFYQLSNIARLIAHRLHARHLKMAFFVGGGRLLFAQVLVYMLGRLTINYKWLSELWGYSLPAVQVVAALFIFCVVVKRMVESKPMNIDKFMSDRELPTVSVLIPARNEDQSLIECLKTVVANDYPKLEILVLDDCSSTARIPEIVKDFAHDGVRFIQGDEPKDDWLPKNQAYEALADSASGEWLLFMGVDVRLGTGSIRSLVNYTSNHQKSMVSVLPHRFGPSFWAGFFSPLRYFREIIKVSVRKPKVPSLSTAWLIKKDAYYSIGGVASVSRKIVPEHYFANQLSIDKKYAFVRTNEELQITTVKSLSEQVKTSLRVIYPGFHGRMEWSAMSNLAALILLFVPFLQLVYVVQNGSSLSSAVYAAIVVLLTVSHLLIVLFTNPVLWPLAVVNFPYLVLQEIVLGVMSMYRYEFGEVYWKDRNICLPNLEVIPHLPHVDS
jgi:hypothetical protein